MRDAGDEKSQRSSAAHAKQEHRRLWQPNTPAGNYTIKNTQSRYCMLIKMPSLCSGGVASPAGENILQIKLKSFTAQSGNEPRTAHSPHIINPSQNA